MTATSVFVRDPRRRNLAILAAVALVATLLALLALWHQTALMAPKYTPESVFPGLVRHDREIARIQVQSKAHGSFDVTFVPTKGWVLPSMHDYPADFAQVRKTVVGMIGLTTIEPTTARPDWLQYLNLRAPEHGRGVAVTLYDEKGHVLAALIVGKSKSIGEPGSVGLFVRKPGSDQSWLAKSVFTPDADPADWMSKKVVSLARADIQSVSVNPTKGPSYTVERAKPADADFALADLPKGRELAYVTAPDGPAESLVDFTFDKAEPLSEIDFSHAAELVTRTFDGLVVTACIAAQGGDSWVSFSAAAAGTAKKGVTAEAHRIDTAASGWAFQIPAFKAAQFTTPLENLLKPVAGKTPAKGKK